MTNTNGDNSDDKPLKTARLSRRGIFGGIAAGAVAASALPLLANAQVTQAGGPTFAPINSRSLDNDPTQGGLGPIRVLFISSYHPFDRGNLFLMLDSLGKDITWCHIEHPAAEQFFDPAIAGDFDVFLFYDAFGGGKANGLGANGHTVFEYPPPSAKLQANLKRLLTNGDKGFVFFHHALASWVQNWPAGVNGTNAYVEMMGGAADWDLPIKNIRGKTYPPSGFRMGTEQHVTVVDRNHPVTAGVEDYDIVDEAYLCPILEDSVHPLLRSSFKPTVDKFAHSPNGSGVGAGHPPGSDLVGWVKTAENTPVVYLQHGHDNNAWSHPAFKRLLLNAIKWTASPEAKSWAKANSKRIFV